jgi:hypothetical protein
MSEMSCGYTGDREGMLMAYLYDEIEPAERATFEAHLGGCARCRVELSALGGVRGPLARWAPPEFGRLDALPARREPLVGVSGEPPRSSDHAAAVRTPHWWHLPLWAQAAAAALVLGVSAGVANLNVHYDAANGLNIRTGWKNEVQGVHGVQEVQGVQRVQGVQEVRDLVSRDELARLERQLRDEMRTAQTATSNSVAHVAPADTDVLRRVKAMVDDSERRQQREMALRLAELVREVNAQRQADLRKIDLNLDQGRVEVLKNRQILDYYMQRVSQRQ